jgi:hypothetical protein
VEGALEAEPAFLLGRGEKRGKPLKSEGSGLGMKLTCCSYPKGGTFTTKLDLKN